METHIARFGQKPVPYGYLEKAVVISVPEGAAEASPEYTLRSGTV
jgi:hypothetical protein